MPIDAIETLWINAQRPDSAEGAKISKSEADAIIYAVTGDGKVTQAEVNVVDQIIKQIGQAAERSDADAELDAIDFDLSGRRNLDSAGANTNLRDIVRIKEEMDNLEANRQNSSADAAHKIHLLEKVTYIRQQIEVARRVPTMVDKLSRELFLDWVITDGEAYAALKELEAAGDYANVVIKNLGSKYLTRLADQLPTDGKARLWKVIEGLDTETRSYVHKTIGRDLWNQLQKA